MKGTKWNTELIAIYFQLYEAMSSPLKVVATLFTLALCVSRAQAIVPASFPALKYPPLARIARVQGDVVVSFRRTSEGRAIDVEPISGSPLLQATAVESVKFWRFEQGAEFAGKAVRVTFHFRLNPPHDGYDDGQPATKVELDGTSDVQVISILTTGLERSECPSSAERVPPTAVVPGDFVEVRRWNETIRVDADGLALWKRGSVSRTGRITSTEAQSLLQRFRAPAVWGLCGSYYQAGLMDGGGSSFKVRIGGLEKSVREYGGAAPPIFREVELLVDAASNTHQWRHGDPSIESIMEISYEYLPKPGKTKLMDAAHSGDKAGFQAALAAGDKLTDVDASGWTPLMYAAGSYGNSEESAILTAGVDVNARSKRGETALMASAATGMADEDLLKAGADVHAVNDVGMTALMLLVQRGRPDEIETLLRTGADARKKDSEGRTALDYLNAANCGSPLVQQKGSQWVTVGYSRCNALGDDYRKSKQLLKNAGAKKTRRFGPASHQN